jgi:hypothetical protein
MATSDTGVVNRLESTQQVWKLHLRSILTSLLIAVILRSVLHLGWQWLIAVVIPLVFVQILVGLQRINVLGWPARLLDIGQHFAWWFGTSLYACVLANWSSETTVPELQLGLHQRPTEGLVDGAGSLLYVTTIGSVLLLSWNVRQILRLKEATGRMSSTALGEIAWLLTLLPGAVLTYPALLNNPAAALTYPAWVVGSADMPFGPLPIMACLVLTAAQGFLRRVAGPFARSESHPLLILVPEADLSRHTVRQVNWIATRWQRGPVVVLARPSEAARMAGHFSALTASLGALPILIPRTVPDLSDSYAWPSIDEAGAVAPIREIYPALDLWPEAVHRIVVEHPKVFVVTGTGQHASRHPRFDDLPQDAFELLKRTLEALPYRTEICRVPARPTINVSTSRWDAQTVTEILHLAWQIFLQAGGFRIRLSRTRKTRLLIAVCDTEDLPRVKALKGLLEDKKDVHGYPMQLDLLVIPDSRLAALRMLRDSIHEKNVPFLEIGWRQLQRKAWIRVVMDAFVPILPFRFLRAADPIDVLVFAPRAAPTETAQLRAWRSLRDTLGAGVFSRVIAVVPDDQRRWPPISCQFQLGPSAHGISDADGVADWARRLLVDELSPYQPERTVPTPETQAADEVLKWDSSQPDDANVDTRSASRHTVTNGAHAAYSLLVAIDGPDNALLGTGMLISGRSLSRTLPEEPVFVTLSSVLNGRPISALSFYVRALNMKLSGEDLFDGVIVNTGDLMALRLRYSIPPYSFLSVSERPPEQGALVSIVDIADIYRGKPAILHGWTLEQKDNDASRYLRYATVGRSLSPGSPLIDPFGKLIGLHVSGEPSRKPPTSINRAVLLTSLQAALEAEISAPGTIPPAGS